MKLQDRILKLGYSRPDLRDDLRPILDHVIKTASTKLVVTGSDRIDWADKVYEMTVKTYKSIGVPLSKPSDLMKYPRWYVYLEEGKAVAFACMKVTPFGYKSGLSGFDGSPEGKRIQLNNIRTKFKEAGYYGEVSHKVEDIVLQSGAPVVPVEYVADILNKDIQPTGDGEHYRRSITGVGNVEKLMVGRPQGLERLKKRSASSPGEEDDDFVGRDAHALCLLFT